MKRKANAQQKIELPHFIAPTTAALTTWRHLFWATQSPGLHLFIGESGTGKSVILRAFAHICPERAVYVEAPACVYSTYPAGTFLKNVLKTVEGKHCLPYFDSVSVAIERVARSLSTQRRALIVDEASHLPRSLLQLLRWVSDAHYQNLFTSNDADEDAQSDDAFLTPARLGSPLILAGVPRLRKRVAALDEVEGRVISEHTLPALTVSDMETILLTRFADRQVIKWIMQQADGRIRRALAFAEEIEQAARESGVDPRALTFNDLTDAPMAAMSVI